MVTYGLTLEESEGRIGEEVRGIKRRKSQSDPGNGGKPIKENYQGKKRIKCRSIM